MYGSCFSADPASFQLFQGGPRGRYSPNISAPAATSVRNRAGRRLCITKVTNLTKDQAMKALNELHQALEERRAERRYRRALRNLPGGVDAATDAKRRRLFASFYNC